METLQPNTSYHIFNHANGFENVFREEENYRFFLEKYRVFITPVVETYAYCLLPNHFHLVVRIRKREVIEEIIRNKKESTSNNFSKVPNFGKVILSNEEIERYLSKQFANLFSSYTQSFNKVYKRMGSLFIKNFKREPILDKEYFINAIIYTHRNPIHHGFYTSFTGWCYSSYCEIIEMKSELVEVEKIIKIFESPDRFVEMHERNLKEFKQSFELEAP
jgi:putative transposase